MNPTTPIELTTLTSTVIEVLSLLVAVLGLWYVIHRTTKTSKKEFTASVNASFDKIDKRFQQQELTLNGIEHTVSPYASQISKLQSQQLHNTTDLVELRANVAGIDKEVSRVSSEVATLRNQVAANKRQ